MSLSPEILPVTSKTYARQQAWIWLTWAFGEFVVGVTGLTCAASSNGLTGLSNQNGLTGYITTNGLSE